MIPFEKYEATGNDFAIFDFFNQDWFDLDDEILVKTLCDRHFGIGADGLIALKPSETHDFNMVYFNADGRRSSFCGNGSRASLCYMLAKQNKQSLSFEAMDGVHRGMMHEGLIRVQMSNIDRLQLVSQGALINSGSPHLIIESEDPMNHPVDAEGRRIRQMFNPEGVNVNFVKLEGNKIVMATYERGVEGETLACGTGVTAAAYYFNVQESCSGQVTRQIQTKGGALSVDMHLSNESAEDVWLTGPARKVFSGFYYLP